MELWTQAEMLCVLSSRARRMVLNALNTPRPPQDAAAGFTNPSYAYYTQVRTDTDDSPIMPRSSYVTACKDGSPAPRNTALGGSSSLGSNTVTRSWACIARAVEAVCVWARAHMQVNVFNDDTEKVVPQTTVRQQVGCVHRPCYTASHETCALQPGFCRHVCAQHCAQLCADVLY